MKKIEVGKNIQDTRQVLTGLFDRLHAGEITSKQAQKIVRKYNKQLREVKAHS